MATLWTVARYMGFSRQEYWSGLQCPPLGDLPDPGIKPRLLHLLHCRWILNSQNHLGSLCVCVLVTQSCLTLCDPMDCSPPGSSVHEISQARILERVAISFSRGSSQPRNRTHTSCLAGRFFTTEPPGRQLEGSCAVSCKWFSFYICLVLSNTKKNL